MVGKALAGNLLYNLVKEIISLARVAEPVPRVEPELQRLLRPVRQSARMRQNVPDRNPFDPLVIRNVKAGRPLCNGFVELEDAPVDEAQHEHGKHRLGERCRFEHRVDFHRRCGLRIFYAVRLSLQQIASANQLTCNPGHPVPARQTGQLLLSDSLCGQFHFISAPTPGALPSCCFARSMHFPAPMIFTVLRTRCLPAFRSKSRGRYRQCCRTRWRGVRISCVWSRASPP